MAASHRGIALLIANSSYDYLDNIENALNDESAMSRKLESCDYEIISAINLDIDEIKTKISLLKHRLAESQHHEVLIYYAGHGLVHNDEHYIAGGRYNEKARFLDDEIDLKCLSVDSDIINCICRIRVPEEKTRSIVVILDACRSRINPFDRGTTSDGRLFVPLKPRHETRIGVLVCYACALGSGARDSGKHGLYTDCLLQNIFEPGKSVVNAISIANRMASERANAYQLPVMQVNYTDFFQYPLIQPEDAYDTESLALQKTNKRLQREIEKLRAKIQIQEEGAPAPDEPQRTFDHDNELLQTEHEKLKLEKEKLEQEFQLAQIELAKFRLEKSKIKLAEITLANSKRKDQFIDSEIMEKIYELTGGALWTRNKDRLSWKLNSCTSEFREADGRITYMNLSSNNLIGSIPSELQRLFGLTVLNLSFNRLEGAIPVELVELKNLKCLVLSGNQLTGAIPVELGESSKLEELYLYNNQLTGAIPQKLEKLSNLEVLCFYNNQLTGTIPLELGKVLKLKGLYLHKNKLTGGSV